MNRTITVRNIVAVAALAATAYVGSAAAGGMGMGSNRGPSQSYGPGPDYERSAGRGMRYGREPGERGGSGFGMGNRRGSDPGYGYGPGRGAGPGYGYSAGQSRPEPGQGAGADPGLDDLERHLAAARRLAESLTFLPDIFIAALFPALSAMFLLGSIIFPWLESSS